MIFTLPYWYERFNLDCPALDEQHQRLYCLAANLHNALQLGLDSSVQAYMLDHLEQNAVAHFDFEENLMEQHALPELSEHRSQHHQDLDELAELRSLVENGCPGVDLAMAMGQLFVHWFEKHIADFDRLLAGAIRHLPTRN